MSEVVIRERTSGDLPSCVHALAAVHEADRYPIVWPTDPVAWLSPPDLLAAWVAETEGGRTVGHVALTAGVEIGDGEKPDALVSRLFVPPEGRRRRVGTQLLAHAQSYAAAKHMRLMLEVAELGDGAAISLYESRGWQHVHTARAGWTTPTGDPVSLRYYEPVG